MPSTYSLLTVCPGPFGAIIVKDNKIISKGYNKKQNKNIATRHAEIEVIEKACKKLKTWHLDDCEMYVTMEPCLMCIGAISQSRIKLLTYGVVNDKFGCVKFHDNFSQKAFLNHSFEVKSGILQDEIEKMLKEFFKEMRNKK